jgi:hypothetical protein
MRWNNLFLIKLAPDKTIDDAADVYRKWEGVPEDQCWADPACPGWKELKDGCFQQCSRKPTIGDKLMIIAHGSPTQVGIPSSSANATQLDAGFDGPTLAKYLRNWGVQEFGLITFKACYIGGGNFLEKFVAVLPKFQLSVGWVKGYKGPATTIERDWLDAQTVGGKEGQPYESITRESGMLSSFLSSLGVPAYGDDRLKIVRGNAASVVTVKGSSRFTI